MTARLGADDLGEVGEHGVEALPSTLVRVHDGQAVAVREEAQAVTEQGHARNKERKH